MLKLNRTQSNQEGAINLVGPHFSCINRVLYNVLVVFLLFTKVVLLQYKSLILVLNFIMICQVSHH